MNGITYYRLKSDYTGDYTKNCALNGTEVDNNFYVLEGRDVKSIAVKGKDIVVTLMNGNKVTANDVLNFVKPEDVKSSVVKVEFDSLNGVLKLTMADGTIQHIEGFSTNENTDISVSTDNTLWGDGLRNKPLGVSPSARTGHFKTVKSIINISKGAALPCHGNMVGDRYLTCEDVSDYGYLYDYKAVRDIACELKRSGWRIPTKADWDDLLNAIEPVECDKNHDKSDKNRFLGKWAGKLLKSKTMWLNGCDMDDDHHHHDFDHDDHHHHDFDHDDHHHHDFDHDDHHHHDFDCHDNVCFDYTDDKCVGTRESESHFKYEKRHDEHQGLDAFGFRATPAGYADDGCNFGYFRERAGFWTGTTNENNTKAYIKRLQYNKDGVYQDIVPGNFRMSLRLIKDYNGKNYFDVEEIMDMEYPTLLLPSVKRGKAIWTSANFACANASLHPILPNNGQGLTFTRHYFINEWNGFKWVRNEMKQGDSVTVAKAPKGQKMVEFRVVGNELVSVTEMIYKDVMHEFRPVFDHIREEFKHADAHIKEKLNIEIQERKDADAALDEKISFEKLTREDVEKQLWNAINAEAQAREDVDNQQWEAINNEIAGRLDVDKQQWDAINNEATLREQTDTALWEGIHQEAAAREDVDNQQWTAINNETAAREDVERQLWEAINNELVKREEHDDEIWDALHKEAAAREDVDNQQWEAINNEAKLREETDTALWNGIHQEAAAREEVEGQLWDAINAEAQAREDVDNQQWTAINNESQIREEIDNQQWDVINNEIAERKAKDEEIEGKLLTEEGTKFNKNTGRLTLKSAAGTNDIKVQFSFNFGEF